jgi:hypothetical protein
MGMDEASERFDGNVLSLVTEQNFERMFQYDLPSARISGGIPTAGSRGSSRNPGVSPCPSLEIAMVDVMRPNPYQAEGADCSSFLQREMQDPNALKKPWAFLLASYFLSPLAKVSSVENLNALSGGAERRKAAPKSEPVFAGSSRVLTERSAR